MNRSIWIGYDSREAEAFGVCRHSIRRRSPDIPVHTLHLDTLRDTGLYTRPTSRKPNQGNASGLWDDISEAPMSTEFANSRWLVPHLAKTGWALFIDCDFMARCDVRALFDLADDRYAVMCVQHDYRPKEAIKMDGQQQTQYGRKNWSSACLWNVEHPSNKKLTLQMVNGIPGRDLHRFCWLDDSEIGALPHEWNYLVGHTELPDGADPKLVHWTAGGPWFEAYRNTEFADEWRAELRSWLCA